VVATTWRGIASPELIDLAGVGVKDLHPFAVRQRRFEGRAGVVVIPERVVGGELPSLDADPLDDAA